MSEQAGIPTTADVVVVGGGNAALCAALSATEAGAEILVLERAPRDEAGGNTTFTGGGMRFAYDSEEQIRSLLPNISEGELDRLVFDQYSKVDFYNDIGRVTEYRADPDLAEILVEQSYPTLRWLSESGVRFEPSYERQTYMVDGRHVFYGGAPVQAAGGGPGLVEALTRAVQAKGATIAYDARALELLTDDGQLRGVRVKHRGKLVDIEAKAVVLGSGGFQANTEWRARYLGPGWDLAKVRGTRFNTGDGIRMALDIGAAPHGHWSGCHAVGWDMNAPEYGNLMVGNGFNRHAYTLGVMVNAEGHRFVDEGADIRNFTYAKYGKQILAQTGQFAWQIFDAKVAELLPRRFYRIREVTKMKADTLEELVALLDGVDAEQCLATLEEYNRAATSSNSFDPTVKDGKCTTGLALPKSNWANPIDEPPFEAFAVTCGITFTFGGLRVTLRAEVVGSDGPVIDGLYACGELVGGLFYHNYPGNSGLTWGSVMGRIAGRSAAAHASTHSMAEA